MKILSAERLLRHRDGRLEEAPIANADVATVTLNLVVADLDDLVDTQKLGVLSHLASFRSVAPISPCMRVRAFSTLCRRFPRVTDSSMRSMMSLSFSMRRETSSPLIEPKHVQNRAVDDDPGAVADLGQPLREHMKNISIRARPRQAAIWLDHCS